MKAREQLDAERMKRIDKERSLMDAGRRHQESEQRKKQQLQQQFEHIRAGDVSSVALVRCQRLLTQCGIFENRRT